jgi:hypothetical protein
MATGTILLPIQAAAPPDGSASNAAPRLIMQKGSNTAPARFVLTASFDPSTQQHLWFTFYVPTNYASGGTVRLMWAANATTGACMWGASVGVQASSNADAYTAHAQATAVNSAAITVLGTTARRPLETTIALGANLDSMAVDTIAYLVVYRVAANAGDTLSVDAELLSAAFDYTTL